MTIHQEPTPVPDEIKPELTDDQLKALAGGYEHSTSPDEQTPEHHTSRADARKAEAPRRKAPKWLIPAVAGALALGGVTTGVVVASNQSEPVAEAPGDPTDAPAPVEPSAEPTPVETEAPVAEAEYSVSRESVAAYIEMSPDEFATLPKTEQLKLVAYYMQGSDELGGLVEFSDMYYTGSGDPRDVLPGTISADNDAQEIATVMAYSRRFIFAVEGDERQKLLYAVLQRGTSSGGYAVLQGISESNPVTTPKIAGVLAVTGTLTAATATESTELMSDEIGQYKNITLQDGTLNRANYYEIPVDEGSFKIWISD